MYVLTISKEEHCQLRRAERCSEHVHQSNMWQRQPYNCERSWPCELTRSHQCSVWEALGKSVPEASSVSLLGPGQSASVAQELATGLNRD
eukprot:COSAG02_NODE_422_length_22587_cov_10.209089_26_plen_90_part_00